MLRMEAYNLAQVDKRHDMYMQAWLNHQVTATNKKGTKPLYPKFEDFFNYEKQIEQIQGGHKLSDKHKRMAMIAKQVNERG